MDGRFSLFLPVWQRITSDQFLLEVVRQGYSFPFVGSPPLLRIPVETPLPGLETKREVLWEEVPPYQGGYGDCPVVTGPGGCYYHCFMYTNHAGGFHPILNLGGLNTYLCVSKFLMQTLDYIIQGLHQGW